MVSVYHVAHTTCYRYVVVLLLARDYFSRKGVHHNIYAYYVTHTYPIRSAVYHHTGITRSNNTFP
mgnify:CR=1 FL=1